MLVIEFKFGGVCCYFISSGYYDWTNRRVKQKSVYIHLNVFLLKFSLTSWLIIILQSVCPGLICWSCRLSNHHFIQIYVLTLPPQIIIININCLKSMKPIKLILCARSIVRWVLVIHSSLSFHCVSNKNIAYRMHWMPIAII